MSPAGRRGHCCQNRLSGEQERKGRGSCSMLIKDHGGNETVEPVTRVRCGGGCYYSFAESGKTSAVMSHKCNIHSGSLTNTPEGVELQQEVGFGFTLLIDDK